jgi:predicted glycosyltransferase
MKIIQYCQHVLGIGHYFRTIEICRALEKHEVILVTGGARVDVPLPNNIREIRLPELMMDNEFKNIFSTQAAESVDRVKEERQKSLWDLFEKESPDLFIVELYPFGRKAFRFELDPILKGIHRNKLSPSLVVCSLRDILVEKKDTGSYENRVVKILNSYFDALLIHADPRLLKLDETFSGIGNISVPLYYTGFVSPKPQPDARLKFRKQLGIRKDEKLLIASAGGGKVGGPLLKAVAEAFKMMDNEVQLHIFTGPFLNDETFAFLKTFSSPKIRVSRFTSDFLSFLAAADLSVSMAGYNTCMNIMAAQVPALVWPFGQNREQQIRAAHLSRLGGMRVLEDDDLNPLRLADLIIETLSQKIRPAVSIDLNGAVNTANRLESLMKQ